MKKLVTLLASIALLASCTKEDYGSYVTVVYDAWKHDASNRTDQEIRGLLDKKANVDDYNLRFTELSKYYLRKNNGDWYRGWNKVLGTYQFDARNWKDSFGMHFNSHRIAWRYNPDTDDFDVATYTYKNGERSWEVLHEGVKEGEVVVVKNFDKRFAYKATAYFGGVYRYNKDVVIYVW